MSFKTCTSCKEDLPKTNFGVCRKANDGLQWACKQCSRLKQYEYYHNNKIRIRKERRDRKIQNPIQSMLWSAKSRASKKGLEFDLTEQDIVIPSHCPLLGMELIMNNGRRNNANSPSLDRIDSSKGYIKGNVQVISYRANTIKSDSTIEELELLLNNWKRKI